MKALDQNTVTAMADQLGLDDTPTTSSQPSPKDYDDVIMHVLEHGEATYRVADVLKYWTMKDWRANLRFSGEEEGIRVRINTHVKGTYVTVSWPGWEAAAERARNDLGGQQSQAAIALAHVAINMERSAP